MAGKQVPEAAESRFEMSRVLLGAVPRLLSSALRGDPALICLRPLASHGFQQQQSPKGHPGSSRGGMIGALAGLGILSFGLTAAWPQPVAAKAPTPAAKPAPAAGKQETVAPESGKKADPIYTAEVRHPSRLL